jgi:hypothetical protein
MPAERKADRAGQASRPVSAAARAEIEALADELDDLEPAPPLPGVAAAEAAEALSDLAAAGPPPPTPAASAPRLPASQDGDLLAAVKKAGRSRARADRRASHTLTVLQEAVREARPHHSLREIAAAAGVSHWTVDEWTKP